MEVVQYKCPNCGGSLEFEPVSQKFTCHYCDSAFTQRQMDTLFEENARKELDVADEDIASDGDFSEASLYNCPNCGAEIISENNTAATFCFYCNTPVVLTGRLAGKYKPAYVIPFKTIKDDADTAFHGWCGKKWFLPKDFKSQTTLDTIQGVYLPYWLGDCRVKSHIVAECEENEGSYTSVYKCEREGVASYIKIPSDASKKADDVLTQNIEPFDYNEIVDFDMKYLTGHIAEKFDVTEDEVRETIHKRAKNATEGMLKADLDKKYDSVTVNKRESSVEQSKFNYALLPVWFLSYKFNDRYYHFAMNGQTKKVTGELPVSKLKAALFSAAVGLIVGAAVTLGVFFVV